MATKVSTVGTVPVSDDLTVPVITVPESDVETSDPAIRFEGTAPIDVNVIVYDNDVPLGVVEVDEAGQWQFEPPEPLAEAEHTIVARTTDGQRVSRPSVPVRIRVVVERLPVTGGE